MRNIGISALGLLLLSGASLAAAAPSDDAPNGGKAGNPKCVVVRGEARYRGYGYDHEVEIENACDKAISCVVKTDVNPQPTTVQVAAKSSATVVTFRGSPAREFKPDVVCTFDAAPGS